MPAPSEGFWQRRGALGLYELLLTWWRHRVSFLTSVFITFFALALYYFTFVGERTTPIFNFIQRLEYDSLDTRFRYRPRSATSIEHAQFTPYDNGLAAIQSVVSATNSAA